MQKPLAEILRPKDLDNYIGQSHLMEEGAILRHAIENGNLHSMILWGPPGVGKTTLALLIAQLVKAQFYMLSAINSGVKDIRDVIDKAKNDSQKSILFIDEIHRFSKSQQDSLLGAVEQGVVTLIGATTENPSFEVISPLLSRCQVYILKNLEKSDLERIIDHAKNYLETMMQLTVDIAENEALLRISGGDARKLINAIELVVNTIPPENGVIRITNERVLKIIQKNLVIYDKKGENHYDIISAFIKSIRGSDPNAAVYWLARMLTAGEDALFIARRMIILAAEDIGNANPNALLLANNCFQSVHQIGMPEARIILSQTVTYLASSPKSNAAYMAIEEANEWVKKTGDLPVPLHLRNAPTQLMKEIGYSDNYRYAHNYDGNFVEQEFLPVSISGKKFYEPQNNPRENELRRYLKNCWKEKYRYVILFFAFLSMMFSSMGQDIHYSQFSTAPLYLNPAHAGAFDGVFRVAFNQKTQWLAVTQPFVSFSGSFDAPVYKSNGKRQLIGMGVILNSDKAGDSRYATLQACLTISYTKALDRKNKNKLSLGFYGGLMQRSLEYDKLTFDEQYQLGVFNPTNPITETFGKEKFSFFDCGAGLSWSLTPNKRNSYTAGVSVNHLTQPNISVYDAASVLPMKTLAYFFSKIAIADDYCLSPMIYTAFQNQYREVTVGSNFEYEHYRNPYSNRFAAGGGLFYRWGDALIISAIVQWENIRAGLSYDLNFSSLLPASKARGGFEISISYIFKRASVRKIGNEPCPFDIM